MAQKNFNLGALRQWKPVATGELLEFEVPSGGYREVQLDLMADALIAVRVFSGDESWLVALGDGHMSVRFATDKPVGFVCDGDPEASVYMRTRVQTQVVPASLDPSYTTVEPRPAGPSEEFRRMMQVMKYNQLRREEALRAEFDAKLAERERDAVVEPVETVEPVRPSEAEGKADG